MDEEAGAPDEEGAPEDAGELLWETLDAGADVEAAVEAGLAVEDGVPDVFAGAAEALAVEEVFAVEAGALAVEAGEVCAEVELGAF